MSKTNVLKPELEIVIKLKKEAHLTSIAQMKVYDNKLALWNAETLPEELTIEQLLRTHASIPRNPLIAEVCYQAGYIDSWGRGVEKIANACKEAGLPTPHFSERSGGILVELHRKPIETTEQLGNQLGNQLGSTKETILNKMKANPKISGSQLAIILGISITAVEKNIKQLREDGLIKRIGGTRGYWKIVDQ